MTVPATMQALVTRFGGFQDAPGPQIDSLADWCALAELPTPEPKAGEVLIRVRLASVNPSDLHYVKGSYGQPRIEGGPAGFEGCGDVVAGRGDWAESLVGRRVAFVAGTGGAWADYVTADAATVIPLRDDLRDEDGAAQIVNPLTAMALFDIAREAKAESFVATAAASQLGKLLAGLARDEGIPMIAVVRRESQLELLREQGAAEAVLSTAPDLGETFAELARRMKPRILLDAVADQISADLFFAMPNRARWVVYGQLDPSGAHLDKLGSLIFTGKRIEGFWLTEWMRSASSERRVGVVQEVQARFADGRWRTDVTAVLSLEEAPERLAEALEVPNGKVMLRPGG
ncbi:MAG TPA: zinc-binding dehydrogenase [Paracoccaceae bacterium]|nr:zinc-binding dehydrogenase [Paracoccaceae bacterium]